MKDASTHRRKARWERKPDSDQSTMCQRNKAEIYCGPWQWCGMGCQRPGWLPGKEECDVTRCLHALPGVLECWWSCRQCRQPPCPIPASCHPLRHAAHSESPREEPACLLSLWTPGQVQGGWACGWLELLPRASRNVVPEAAPLQHLPRHTTGTWLLRFKTKLLRFKRLLRFISFGFFDS